jgi:hypothetical protein
MILGRIKITLLNHLTRLLKHFRFSGNEKQVNQNHLKYLFCCFMVATQKLETFLTDSPLKYFIFFPFGTAPSDSSLNQKHFSLLNGTLLLDRSKPSKMWNLASNNRWSPPQRPRLSSAPAATLTPASTSLASLATPAPASTFLALVSISALSSTSQRL